MRLIDADALREHMYHEAFEKDSDLQKWDSGCWIRYRLFESILNTEITVEAEPIKHGSWELVDVTEPRRYGCSKCKRLVFQLENYCPSCGAKMEGWKNETDERKRSFCFY